MKPCKVFIHYAAVAVALTTLPNFAAAQQSSLKEQLVGTWSLVSFDAVNADGTRKPALGGNAIGLMMIDSHSNYTVVFTDPNRPEKWGKSREDTTPEDYKAAAMGLTAQFGTVVVDETASTLSTKVVGALNPRRASGAVTKKISIIGDELKAVETSSAYGGVSNEYSFKRVR